MSGTRYNGWVRSLIAVGVVVAAVVVFAWRSQADQDARIGRNETAVAVIHAKLDGIGEKLDDVKELLKER